MKGKILITLLALGVSGQAAAQDPAANLQNALGNLVPNLTATTDALASMQAADSMVALNRSVGDLHQDLSADTPLETNNNLGEAFVSLGKAYAKRLDRILAGKESPTAVLEESDPQALLTLGNTVLFSIGPSFLARPEGTIADPAVFLRVFDQSLSPFERIQLATLLTTGEGGGGLPLDPTMLSGLGGSGDAAFDLGVLTGLLAGDSSAGALDPAVLTDLLGGSGDAAFDLGVLTGLLAGDSPAGALDPAMLTGLLGGGTGGGLPVDALPLPLDALDPGTLTALLDGGTLPGL